MNRPKSPNFDQVFTVFEENYVLVPLEVFANNPYKTLISTLLSSRTKDEVTLEASKRLFKKAKTINELKKLSTEEIEKLIFPVGFYRTKAKNLKELSEIVAHDYRGKIPNTKIELVKLPGVGTKTANLTLNRAFNTPAIAVDVHVHRITNLLGWVKTKSPEQTEKELVKVVPKKYWSDLNRLFVSIGRQYRSINKLKDFLKESNLYHQY